MSCYDFIAADKKLNPYTVGVEKRDNMIIIEDEDRLLEIFEDEPNCYTKPFTSLPLIMQVQLGSFERIKGELFDYVMAAIEENDTVEIWSTWMGEIGKIEKKTVPKDELSVEDLRWVLGADCWDHPKYLKIFKWTREKNRIQ